MRPALPASPAFVGLSDSAARVACVVACVVAIVGAHWVWIFDAMDPELIIKSYACACTYAV